MLPQASSVISISARNVPSRIFVVKLDGEL